MTRAEWRWAACFAAGVMALTCLPYLAAWAAQTPGWQFGGFLFAVEDGNSYIAKMNLGAHGAWLFTLPYSSEPQRGMLAYLFYLLLGKLAGPSHAALVLWYHAARLALGSGMLLASYAFLAEFLPRLGQRRLGLLLVAFGGGLGWLLTLLGQGSLFGTLPVDFISPEAFSFLTLFGLPHLALARALLLLGLLAFLRGHALAAGLLLAALGLIQPLYVLEAWLVIAAGTVLNRKRWPAAVTAGLLSAPMVLYTAWAFATDPVLGQWARQNVLPAPHPLHYLLAFGLLLASGAAGWRALARRRPEGSRLLAGWLLVTPALLYLPIGPQRRLIEGVQLPLVVLAVLGLTVTLRRCRPWLVPVFVVMSVLTSALLLAGGLATARRPLPPVFVASDRLSAFAWLNEHAQPGQIVLSSYEIGNALPAYTPLVAYIGHGPETIFLAQKQERVRAFYDQADNHSAHRALLADGKIAYVILDLRQRGLGSFDPAAASYLQPVYENESYALYRVRP